MACSLSPSLIIIPSSLVSFPSVVLQVMCYVCACMRASVCVCVLAINILFILFIRLVIMLLYFWQKYGSGVNVWILFIYLIFILWQTEVHTRCSGDYCLLVSSCVDFVHAFTETSVHTTRVMELQANPKMKGNRCWTVNQSWQWRNRNSQHDHSVINASPICIHWESEQ